MKLKRFLYIIIPLLGISYVFYQVGGEGEATSIAHFSFMYLYPLPEDDQINSQNVL
jgi:hypothetical protein